MPSPPPPRLFVAGSTGFPPSSQVQYGGRITDDFDKRLLNTYGEAWFSDNIFHKNWRFAEDYSVPDFKSVYAYRNFIDQLPVSDRLEVRFRCAPPPPPAVPQAPAPFSGCKRALVTGPVCTSVPPSPESQ